MRIQSVDRLDGELRQRAARYKSATAGEILSKNELREFSRMLSPEIASMVFYQSILESKFDSEFISLVNATKLSEADKEFNRKTEIAFVPSSFSNSGLKWSSEGEKILDGCRALGFRTEIIDTLPTKTISENAVVISEYLRECTAQSIILISRNRGSAEVRTLIQQRGPEALEFGKLSGWISITGLINGSRLLEKIVKGQSDSWRERIFNKIYDYKSRLSGENRLACEQVSPGGSAGSGLWDQDLKLPNATQLIQLVGVSRPRHLSSLKKMLSVSLQKTVGPNDGVLMLEESWVRQGLRYPLWGLHSGSDYLAYKNVLERVLLALIQSQKFDEK